MPTPCYTPVSMNITGAHEFNHLGEGVNTVGKIIFVLGPDGIIFITSEFNLKSHDYALFHYACFRR